MSLLAIDNQALTLQAYLPMLKNLALGKPSLWTSASSEGLFCALERTFAWCSSGRAADEAFVNNTELWTAIPSGNETNANCVTLGLNKNGSSAQLSLAACSESKSFMCQV